MARNGSRATSMPGPRRASARGDLFDAPARDEAVDVLFRRHYEEMLRLAYCLLGDRSQAEHAVQDAFGLTTRVVLDLPTQALTATSARLPQSDVPWQSQTTVLAVGDLATRSSECWCDVRTGSLEQGDRARSTRAGQQRAGWRMTQPRGIRGASQG